MLLASGNSGLVFGDYRGVSFVLFTREVLSHSSDNSKFSVARELDWAPFEKNKVSVGDVLRICFATHLSRISSFIQFMDLNIYRTVSIITDAISSRI